MKARGVVFEKPLGSTGERLPHPLRVRLIDGPNADPEGPGFYLRGSAPIGATVVVEYAPHGRFARLVAAVPDEAVTAPVSSFARRRVLDHWTSEDIEGSCPRCEAFALVELRAPPPDGTMHVCCPSFGGCSASFSLDSRD